MSTGRRRTEGSGGNKKGSRESFGSIRTMSSGRFQARFTHPETKVEHRGPRTFVTKRDAQDWLARQRADISRGVFTTADQQAPRITLTEYAGQWLTNRPRALKPRTEEHYRDTLRRIILPRLSPGAPALGDMHVGDLTPAHISRWYAAVGSHRPVARARAYSLLKSILSHAVDEDLLTRNPCRIKGAATSRTKRKVDPLSRDELDALVAALPEHLRTLALVSVYCGLRFGEATELRRKDIDLTAKVIKVRRAVSRVGGEFVVGDPKSEAGTRTVPIANLMVPVLREHLSSNITGGRDGLVFPRPTDPTRHMSQQSVHRSWKKACATIGRPELHWHDLRHTSATWMAEAGATVKEMMRFFGWTTPGMAAHYVEVSQGRMEHVVERMSARAAGGEQR